MAAKGTAAKAEVMGKIAEVFGENFIGEVDKKLYVWANDGGERIQVAIALTCPKVPVESASPIATRKVEETAFSWGGPIKPEEEKRGFPGAGLKPSSPAAAEITEEERNRIATLIERLGL